MHSGASRERLDEPPRPWLLVSIPACARTIAHGPSAPPRARAPHRHPVKARL